PAVLIPRPSTELLVEIVLERFPNRDSAPTIADVCTGCGCVAVAISHERRAATIVATDISGDALQIAKRNALRHRVSDRVTFCRADLLDGIVGRFDAVVANPPYVLDGAARALQPEVLHHEPRLALFGGADGLDLVNRLVADAPKCLGAGGLLVFEFGAGQEVEVEELIAASPDFALAEIRRDLEGIARTAVARKR